MTFERRLRRLEEARAARTEQNEEWPWISVYTYKGEPEMCE